ncbi:MAG TPA: RNA methyltransferase [Bacteroidota bacterium]|nr:RNA methyltransferase [Bacteroidota bacterium]
MRITKTELKYLRSLTVKKIRAEERKFLLEGWKPLHDALHSNFHVDSLYVADSRTTASEQEEILAFASSRNIPIQEISEKELRQISKTVTAQGVVAVVEQCRNLFSADVLHTASFVVALDEVGDPGNLGTIIRTCDWFGVDAVLMSKGCVSLYNEKVVRSTSGSIFHLPIYEDIDLRSTLTELKNHAFTVIATTMNGRPLAQTSMPPKTVLVFGNEAKGICDSIKTLSDHQVSIPRFGQAESLNVGVACAVFLSQWRLAK